jgi:hypothetical protein
VWYSGGRLAVDLTLPKLRHRWERSGNTEHPGTRPEHSLSAHSVRALLRSSACSAAKQARNEAEFFAGMERAGILIRTRFSVRDSGEITGYSVTLPGHVDMQGQPIWYGGGRLSAGLTLPRLRHGWNTSHFDHSIPISPQERRAIWCDVTAAADRAAEHIRRCAGRDPSAAADVVWATADTLRAAASVMHGGPSGELLGQAADRYDRAARETDGRIPGRSPGGVDLRTAARLLTLLGRGSTRPPLAALHLVMSLLALAAEVAKLRDVQQRIVQADASRTVEGESSPGCVPGQASRLGKTVGCTA